MTQIRYQLEVIIKVSAGINNGIYKRDGEALNSPSDRKCKYNKRNTIVWERERNYIVREVLHLAIVKTSFEVRK